MTAIVFVVAYSATSSLIVSAAAVSASCGSLSPKITDSDQASRKVCQTSIELATLGTSMVRSACSAKAT